jgi:hypothetical protein
MHNKIIVNNPLATNMMVYMKPNQLLELAFTNDYGLVDVEITSDFLNSKKYLTNDGTTGYEIEHVPEIECWSKISQTFLGEIKIIHNQSCCLIGVVLDSEISSIITTINPEECEIRLRSNQVLEIVLLNCNSVVNSEIISGSCGIQYFGVDVLSHHENLRNFPSPAKSYFFKLSNDVDKWPVGTYNAGCIILNSDNEKYSVFLNLKIKRKDRWKNLCVDHYQEIDLKPKFFTLLEEGCKLR